MKLENEILKLEVDPLHGGRIISFFDKVSGQEQLWYDASRLPVNPALDYDGNFAGGIDELLPNDPPEAGFPDHGELWMTELKSESDGKKMTLSGTLPLSRLAYRRTMHLEGKSLISEYSIVNTGEKTLDFLWKLHAALVIGPGDRLIVPARCRQAADPGNWSKSADGMPAHWRNPYVIGGMDGSSDFFFLTDLAASMLTLERRNGTGFRCQFEAGIFPCIWIFASFGRLNGSRTLIMEPCTNYPLTIEEAKKAKCCARLEPGAEIHTAVKWTSEIN